MTDQSLDELGKQRDRALVHSAAATILAKIVVSASSVLTFAIAAHALSKPELGVVAVLTLLVVFLGFGDLGLGTLMMTRLPAANARNDQAEMRLVVGATLSALNGVAVVVAGVGGVSAYLLPWPSILGAESLPQSDVRMSVLCFFVLGGIAIPASVGSRVLSAMQRASVVRAWNAAAAVVALVLTIGCARAHAPMWSYVVAIAGAMALLPLIQLVWILTKTYPDLRPPALFMPLPTTLAYLRSASQFAVISLGWLIAYCIDSLVVSSTLGAAAAAVFSVAARMFNLVGGTLNMAGQQMWPALTDAITRGDVAWARSRFRGSLILSTAVNATACLLLVILGRPLARVWVGASLAPPLSLLIVMAVWTVYLTAVNQGSYLLTAVERVRMLAVTGLIMAPVNLVLSIVLTRTYGMTGPILGSIFAMVLVQFVPVVVLCRRVFHQLDDPTV
ncbi:MAG: polysaccharide biosynthesis protein, partial [Pseudonocardiales bacterium]|nr:polysaccharide biosynthesis protein [Pseudonocardiales bacterium]